jgi:small-conductance mechanosensitive channel
MSGQDLASDFWDANSGWIVAILAIAGSAVLALALDRALSRRGDRLAQAVARGEISPETDTRLRFIRRLLSVVIVLIGVAIALSQFEGVNRIAASLLASGAIAAAILGFAARQTLANFVAGIMLAVTQPLRVGDWVFVEDNYGVVEDIRLTYTFLRTLGDERVVIPNERLAAGVLRNDTLGGGPVGLDVQIWLPAGADAARAVATLERATGQTVRVAESAIEGFRLAVGGEPCLPPERAAREAELRLRCLEQLQSEGLLTPSE